MITDDQLTELEKYAERATPGERVVYEHHIDLDTCLALIRELRAARELVKTLELYADKNNWTSESTVYYEKPDGTEGEYTVDLNDDRIWQGEFVEGYGEAQDALSRYHETVGDE